ncbi:phytanoyl-CoA dioxygenase family protein [Streptomyces sp. NBC_00893]|uniref:phytanoyl-CoA dioxygenase family protein n=1 Tax=Streptomyces sp. NBC_00893 TaxID=2975862 RepID=UPI00224DA7DB|nr:phytanoyl-CoA dioxygenase family protein [Streptomyces sp. NBC_00893]MCX4850657.1 phytanoyl-CoA dioxygenase family protein [Streptomyces sp. NBC_00893]
MTTTTRLTVLPGATATVDEVVDVIRREGGVVIDGFLKPSALAELHRQLEPVLDRTRCGDDAYFAGTMTRRAGGLFGRLDLMPDIALHPLYYGAAKKILQKPVPIWAGDDRVEIVPDIQVGVTQAIQIQPGQGDQRLHRDDSSFLWRHPDYGREGRVQIMVAVSDFTEENGGTLVIPGSHLWDDERGPRREEAVSTCMRAGSALIWIGSTYHGGGDNSSDAPRTGLTMAFDLACLRQEENQFLSIPRDKLLGLSEEIQRLLGWGSGENLMGYVERDGQMVDAHVLLENDAVDLPTVR